MLVFIPIRDIKVVVKEPTRSIDDDMSAWFSVTGDPRLP